MILYLKIQLQTQYLDFFFFFSVAKNCNKNSISTERQGQQQLKNSLTPIFNKNIKHNASFENKHQWKKKLWKKENIQYDI